MLKAINKVFKKIIPLSIARFDRKSKKIELSLKQLVNENKEIKEYIQLQKEQMVEIKEFILLEMEKITEIKECILLQKEQMTEIKLQKEQIINFFTELKESMLADKEQIIRGISNEFINLKKDIPKKEYYKNTYERKVIESFYDITAKADFKKMFISLIKGLDIESIETVIKILKRQQILLNTEEQELDILTVEEQNRIREITEDFKVNKFKIADDLYCYKNYLLPVDHFETSVFVDRHGLEKVENIEETLKKDIIDVGAFIGDSILVLSPLTQKSVYAFEAITENYELLQTTVGINNIKNVVAEKIALGATNDTITFNVAGSTSGYHKPLASKITNQETVNVITLDSYVEEHHLEVGLIKVDIEGSEQEFLKGAKNTIEKFKPILLVSIYHNASDFFNIKPLIESWNLGYKFKIHKPKDFTISREVLLIAEI